MSSQILKTFLAGDTVYQLLYDNVRVNPDDPREVKRLKRALSQSISRHIRSRRFCTELLLRENFDERAWWCTLTFREDRYPAEKVKAGYRWAYFLKRLREQGYDSIRYFKVLEHKHGDARFHFHAVMDGVPRAVIQRTWMQLYGDDVKIKRLRMDKIRGLAAYLSKEAGDEVGRHNYSRSRGRNRLREPVKSMEIVDGSYQLVPPPGVTPIERHTLEENRFGRSSYLFFRAPAQTAGPRGHSKGVGGLGLEPTRKKGKIKTWR